MKLGHMRADASLSSSTRLSAESDGHVGLRGKWDIVCRGADGVEKWRDSIQNLVTNAGEDYMLDVGLSGATATTTWYVGLTDSSPTTAEADTMSSHSGWTEDQNYTEANRVTWTDGGVSGQSVDNSASVASFSINATTTIGGAFLTSNNTKGGTTGTLYAVGAFSGGNRSVVNGDTLEVTATFTAGGS